MKYFNRLLRNEYIKKKPKKMETKKLNRAIVNLGILLFLLIIQHLARIMADNQIGVTIIVYFLVVLFVIRYLIQFQNIFKSYFNIDNIKPQIMGLIITSIINYLVLISIEIFRNGKTLPDIPSNKKIMFLILCFLLLAGLIMISIQYMILGWKLIKQSNTSTIKQLGISYFLVQLSVIGVIIFSLIKTLKPYVDIFIIVELLPYWIILRIYNKLKKFKNETSQTTTTTEAT